MTLDDVKSNSDHVITANRFLGKRVLKGFDETSEEAKRNVDIVIESMFHGDIAAFVKASNEYGS